MNSTIKTSTTFSNYNGKEYVPVIATAKRRRKTQSASSCVGKACHKNCLDMQPQELMDCCFLSPNLGKNPAMS